MKSWQWNRILPGDALRESIRVGVMAETDPGQTAGDHLMSLAAEKGLETPHRDRLFELATHYAALVDVVVTEARNRLGRLYEHEGTKVGLSSIWQSSALLGANGTRLHRILLVSRWSEERKLAETHSYFSLFETAVCQQPLTMTVCVIGQNRDGRYHGPWSRGVQHPLNRTLKFRRRGGKPFKGEWTQVWREEADIDRQTWLEAMQRDGLLDEMMFDIEIPVPQEEARRKMVKLVERRLVEIQETEATPPPSPSVCFWPSRCQFVDACWTFSRPSPRLGYVQIFSSSNTSSQL